MPSEKSSSKSGGQQSGPSPFILKFAKVLNNPEANALSLKFSIVYNTLTFTDGRDKSMKIIQYTLSLMMLTIFRKYKVLTGLHKSIEGTIAMFSDARKVVRLANFTGYFSKLVYLLQGRGYHPQQPLSTIDNKHYPLLVLKIASEFLNAITDDLFCLGKFNVINKATGQYAKEWSYKLWWTSLSVDLYLNVLKLNSANRKLTMSLKAEKSSNSSVDGLKGPSSTELKSHLFNSQLNLIKTVADLIFCGYDLFRINKNKEFMQAAAILSGVLGYYRVWTKTSLATKA